MPKKSRNKVHTKVSTKRTDNGANLYTQFKSLGFESAFEILQISKPRFIQLYNGKLKGNAGKVYDWAMFYINYIAHHYRGNEGTAPKLQADEPLTSDSAMAYSVAYAYAAPPLGSEELKPTYEHLFPEDKDIPVCHPESLKAQTSPVAYLVALYQFVNNLGKTEEGETVAKPIKELFEQRRPDIPLLCLDEKNTNQAISGLELVNTILAATIEKNPNVEVPAGQTLDEFFSYIVYPFDFPFHLAYLQILKALEEKKLVLSKVMWQADSRYPYYLDSDLGYSLNANALMAATNLAPTQCIAIISDGIPYPGALSDQKFPVPAYLIEYYDLYRNPIITPQGKAIIDRMKQGIEPTSLEIEQLYNYLPTLLAEDLLPVPSFLALTSLTRENLDQLFSLKQYAPQVSKHYTKDAAGIGVTPPTSGDYGSTYINGIYGEYRTLLSIEIKDEVETIVGYENEVRFKLINRFIRFQQWTGIKSNELDWLILCSIYVGKIFYAVKAFGLFHYLHTTYALGLEEFTGIISEICPYSIQNEVPQFDRLFNSKPDQPALILDNSVFDYQSDSQADQQTMHQIATGLLIDYQTLQRLAALLVAGNYVTQFTRSLATISIFYRLTKLAQLFGFTAIEFWSLLHIVVQDKERVELFLLAKSRNPAVEGPHNLDIIVALEQAAVWLKQHQLTPIHLTMMLGTGNRSLVATPQSMNLFNDLKQTLEMGDDRTEDKDNAALSQALIKLYQVTPASALSLVRWIGNDFATTILTDVTNLKDEVTDVASLQAKGGVFLAKVYELERHIASSNFLKLTNTELQLLSSHADYFLPGANVGEPAQLNFRLFYLLTRLKDWLALSNEPEEKLLSYFAFANTSPVDKSHCAELLAVSMHWDKRQIEFLFSKLSNADKVAKTMLDIDWILRIKELCLQTGLPANQLLELAALEIVPNTGPGLPSRPVSYRSYAELAEALLATRKVT